MNEPVITLNNRPYPFKEGLTISAIMTERKYDFPAIIVRINNKHIEEEDWQTTTVAADDNVEIIHVFGGG
ncbi:MAG: sulfur carrier protein ThiS [Oscillospiraceae bacterium]|nr:sulfur carrier protein ThiS [Oscillospiraceae bacterium]